MDIGYYIHIGEDGKSKGIWRVDIDSAERVGVSNARGHGNSFVQAHKGETVEDAFARSIPAWFGKEGRDRLYRTALEPGEYFRRMARPSDQYPDQSPGQCPSNIETKNEIATAQGQLIALTRDLQTICQVIQPTKETLDTYGHAIRNLLILACTEVEAHWRGVLLTNGMQKKILDTRDYVKLAPAMRLDEYAISFPFYPWLDQVKPFARWGSTGEPTKEISWYADYHAVKHDRDANFTHATLRNAFDAVAACAVMMCAQYGRNDAFDNYSELRYFFHLAETPSWPPHEVYIYPYDKDMKAKNFF